MLIVGWGGNTKVLGETIPIKCPNCGNEKFWQVVETSRNVKLYFIRVAKWDKQYFHICPICTAGMQLKDRNEAQDLLLEALQTQAEIKSKLRKLLKKEDISI